MGPTTPGVIGKLPRNRCAPVASWPSFAPGPRGEVPDYSDDRFLTAVQFDPGIVSLLDRRSGEALYWVNGLHGSANGQPGIALVDDQDVLHILNHIQVSRASMDRARRRKGGPAQP